LFYPCFFKSNGLSYVKIDEDYEFNLVMNDQEEQMGEIIVTTNNKKFKALPLT
jgi:hypothetical protein